MSDEKASAAIAAKTGVSFDGTHSYTAWGLRLKRVSIGVPQAKTCYVDVPGMNGQLDLTEAQNGGIRYGMRKLEFAFDALDCTYEKWTWLLSKIAKALHGRKCRIILDDDSDYYYSGRCAVSTSKSNYSKAEIVIECNCDPYKLSVLSSDEPWKWDTFNFIDGVIRQTSDIAINSANDWQLVKLEGYVYNETIKIVSNADMRMKYRNSEFSIVTGENIMYDVELYEGENDLYFKGVGVLTIVHRGGMI